MRLIILKTLFILTLCTSALEAKLLNSNDGTILLDTSTRLMWQDDQNDVNVHQWSAAINYCENLSLAGYDDWRLPNVIELRSILDNTRNYPAIDPIFNANRSSQYWSSTKDRSVNGYSWYVNFSDSLSSTNNQTQSYYVRCVRSGINSGTTNSDANASNEELITHNGIDYGVVKSPNTDKKWLDRNLGASQVCTAQNDNSCYGWYYQWGRAHDGHQESNSTTTASKGFTLNSGHNSFTTGDNDWIDAGFDSDGALRQALWFRNDGSSICPANFRVPTSDELAGETTLEGVTHYTSAFNSFLKLPSASFRNYIDGTFNDLGNNGAYWTVSIGLSSKRLFFDINSAIIGEVDYANGYSVRCIEDQTDHANIGNLATGQIDSNATNDDGHYQKGIKRIFTRSNEIVTDQVTGLMWQDDNATMTNMTTFDSAETFCANLSIDVYNDWRLPSVKELLTIVDYTKSTYTTFDTFTNIASANYWTSKTHATITSMAWYVNFSGGDVEFNSKANSSYTRCVRKPAQ